MQYFFIDLMIVKYLFGRKHVTLTVAMRTRNSSKKERDLGLVKLLLNQCGWAIVNARDMSGKTPLHVASKIGTRHC